MPHRLRPVVVAEDGRALRVDAGVGEDGRGGDRVRRAEQVEGKRHGVHAKVEERPAAEGRVEESVGRVDGLRHADVGPEQVHVAEDAFFVDEAVDVVHDREEAGPHRLHQKLIVPPGGVDEPFGLRGVQGEGFLAEDGVPGLQRQGGVFEVGRVWSRHVNDIEGRVGHEGLVGPVPVRNVERVPERVGPGLRPRAHGG